VDGAAGLVRADPVTGGVVVSASRASSARGATGPGQPRSARDAGTDPARGGASMTEGLFTADALVAPVTVAAMEIVLGRQHRLHLGPGWPVQATRAIRGRAAIQAR
jgi:hypothetical protein